MFVRQCRMRFPWSSNDYVTCFHFLFFRILQMWLRSTLKRRATSVLFKWDKSNRIRRISSSVNLADEHFSPRTRVPCETWSALFSFGVPHFKLPSVLSVQFPFKCLVSCFGVGLSIPKERRTKWWTSIVAFLPACERYTVKYPDVSLQSFRFRHSRNFFDLAWPFWVWTLPSLPTR